MAYFNETTAVHQVASADEWEEEEGEEEDDSVFDFCGLGLVWWCRITGLVHLFMCVLVGILILLQELQQIHPSRLTTPVTRSVGLWVDDAMGVSLPPAQLGSSLRLSEDCSIAGSWRAAKDSLRVVPLVLSLGTLDTRIMMVLFYGLSALFQLWGSASARSYYAPLRDGCNHISHFVEYSVSASLMVLAISVQLGVTDLFALVGAMSNIWCCMMFGLLAELLHQEEVNYDPDFRRTVPVDYLGLRVPYYMIAHLAGWVSMTAALATALSNLINFEVCVEKTSSDAFWVVGQVAAYFEIILFVSFGFVQSVYLSKKPGRPSGVESEPEAKFINATRVWWSSVTEFAFILLSLTAKVGLGVMVYAANLI
jgi:hypothetical protein